jgi:hypothetical protein
VHCAQGNAVCADATGDRGNQTTPSPTAQTDSLPNEPGGYSGFQALFGAKYVAPQLGAGTPDLSRNGFQVTNAKGNLVDLNGNEIDDPFTGTPGFTGFDPTAPQTLAYAADYLESGIPVVQTYIADVHGNQSIPALSSVCANAPDALGSGDPCYVAQAKYYNDAFGAFFKRLAADGINTSNTLFVLSSDEGDHEAGANVGRAIQPTPATCDGVTVACTYPSGSFGELAGNITGLLAAQTSDTTKFGMEFDTAPEYYINGNPGPDASVTRTFEHDVARLTAFNPYAEQPGQAPQQIANYLADPAEEAILHMVNADPARTPTLAEFAKPDYYLSQGSATCTNATGTSSSDCVQQDTGFAYDHGDYAAEINTNYVGFAGPGVKNLGVDGPQPNQGPNSAGPDSGQIVVADSGTTGTWTDETDIRPTMMYLLGLNDDYEHDGRVITQILTDPNRALSAPGVAALGACYKQLNSSVGQFANDTLQADTKAIEGSSPGDFRYIATDRILTALDRARDAIALPIKNQLEAAAFQDRPIFAAGAETFACQAILRGAALLTHNTPE